MTTAHGLPLPGCRHDVLGHALKAIGVLRAITECAAPEDRDPSAEGWWDTDSATFRIRSDRYPDADSLAKYFTENYRPSPIIAAWNKSGGVTDKIEVTICGDQCLIERFRTENESQLTQVGLKRTKKLSKEGNLKFSTDTDNRPTVESVVADFNSKLVADESSAVQSPPNSLSVSAISKTSGKKDGTLPKITKLLKGDTVFAACLSLARECVDGLQAKTATQATMLGYRDRLPESVAESFDSLSAFHLATRNNNPLFVNRGQQGNTDIFRMYWENFIAFRKHPAMYTRASLFGERSTSHGVGKPDHTKKKSKSKSKPRGTGMKGKGTPFFPDAIKNYNQGLEWDTEAFPFCPMDYLLAVEGSLAMRGAVSKSLGSNARSYAAFPFVFEGYEPTTDRDGEVQGLAYSFWLPLWTRPTTFGELHSFILDAQARLPMKECRFTSDFARAIRSQGIDAGFAAFQEFRFKMKGADIPWPVAGRFINCSSTSTTSFLNELLAPVDESGFLNQFEFDKERKADLHPYRVPVLEAIEDTAAEPDGKKILDVLCRLADLNTQLAKSKSLRKKIDKEERVTFVPPLRCEDWAESLAELDGDREFEIARALASIRGRERQSSGSYSKVEPFLGSLLPLQRGQRNWFLPDPASPQAVWSGIDLHRDLAAILARRVIDSEADFRPALVGRCSARLTSILAFVRGELDDRRIARLVEALSLIDWQQSSTPNRTDAEQDAEAEQLDSLPVAYAAVRSLVEIACEEVDVAGASSSSPRATVQRAVSLVTRQEPSMVAAGITEALRRLAIVGVPNTYGLDSRSQKPKLAGRDVIAVGAGQVQLQCESLLARRLAAAVLIPLDRQDRWKLFRAITLPQST